MLKITGFVRGRGKQFLLFAILLGGGGTCKTNGTLLIECEKCDWECACRFSLRHLAALYQPACHTWTAHCSAVPLWYIEILLRARTRLLPELRQIPSCCPSVVVKKKKKILKGILKWYVRCSQSTERKREAQWHCSARHDSTPNGTARAKLDPQFMGVAGGGLSPLRIDWGHKFCSLEIRSIFLLNACLSLSQAS